MRTSNHMMLMGDYVKYADDFRAGISRWEKKWGSLNCKGAFMARKKKSASESHTN
jgi:hypothetical protein